MAISNLARHGTRLVLILGVGVRAQTQATQPFFEGFGRNALLFSNGCFCQNGATCDAQNCMCINYYTGSSCEVKPLCDPSNTNPCQNGGSCMDTCTQASGLTAGTECVAGSSAYTCNCINNYHGTHCELANPCFTDTTHTTSSGICKNGGGCTPAANGAFTCTCPSGWMGTTCEDQEYSNTAPCNYNANKITVGGVTSHCLNNGVCVNSPNHPFCTDESCCQDPHFSCDCENSYHGSRCQNEPPCTRNSGFGDCKTDNSQTASCVNGNGGAHTCTCQNGYSGDLCEIEPPCSASGNWCLQNSPIDFSYCKNGATCTNNAGGQIQLSCTCAGQYIGKSCEIAPTCVGSPGICQNGGVCVDNTPVSYQCNCVNGYSGNNCEIAPPCNQNPCVANQHDQCENVNGEAVCVCKTGFNGKHCQNVIADVNDECVGFPAEPNCGGLCVNGECQTCQNGFYGKYCQFSSPCDVNPCQNSGTCIPGTDGSYTCTCVNHFHGKSCQLAPPCTTNPCQNSGICTNLDNGGFSCACVNNWQGTVCDEEASLIHTCQANPCQNSGVWTQTTQTCACVNFYHGPRCELAPPCNASPCSDNCINQANGDYLCAEWCADSLPCSDPLVGQGKCGANGVCNNVDSTQFQCLCTNFYSGEFCTTAPPCDTNPTYCNPGNSACQNVMSNTGSPIATCNCLNYYSGTTCHDPPKCDAQPCQNGAVCTNKFNSSPGFECACVNGYIGQLCDRLPCADSPCQNGGTCEDLPNGAYACECETNYEGTNCQTYAAPPCESAPCQHGGVCTNFGTEYFCDCTDTVYYGTNCENYAACKDPDNGKDKCENGATCLNLGTVLGDSFMCQCARYYYGILCSYYSVACDPNPCINGGVCHIDKTDSDRQWCACAEGWTGESCEIDENAPITAPTSTVDPGDHTFNSGVLSAIIIGSVVTAAVAIFLVVKFAILPKFTGMYSLNNQVPIHQD